MDPLKNELLLRQLADLGYPLISASSVQPKHVLRNTLEADDIRIFEGFPVILVNLLMRDVSSFEQLEEIYESIDSLTLKKRFLILTAVTYQLMVYVDELKDKRRLLSRFIERHDGALLERVYKHFLDRSRINIGGIQIDTERLENTFRNYVLASFATRQQTMEDSVQEKKNRVLRESMSLLFSERQRQIMLKVLREEPLEKTEREYYSRVIKKRLRAIANVDMQTLATTLLG